VRRYTSLRGRRAFAQVLRRGRTSSTKELAVSALAPRRPGGPPEVGLIITAKVGNAVRRNLLRRRCRAIVDEAALPDGIRVVIQCRPAAADFDFPTLKRELAVLLRECTAAAGNVRPRREVGGQ
jgi:ribonuclease P protein component